MQFSCKPNNNISLPINYNNHIANTQSIKFLGLILDTNITWRNHIDYLHTKLGSASYSIRILKSLMPLTTLINIYFYFHSKIIKKSFGVSQLTVIWFLSYKRVLRLIMGIGKRDSCRKIFKELRILLFCCQYIYSILLFAIKNKEIFPTNSEIRSICTRHRTNLHPPSLHLMKAQKGVYFSAIKIYNSLPQRIKKLSGDANKFKETLKKIPFNKLILFLRRILCI
jgi:hypothetical protein